MTDDFVMQAFSDAETERRERTLEAYNKCFGDETTHAAAHYTAAKKVGLEKMDALCKAVFESKNEDILVDYTESLMFVGFVYGYMAAKEETE